MKYFDYAATCPIDDEALQVYVDVSKQIYGNPNSLHDIGGAASALLKQCRAQLANMLHIEKRGIYFTSGGTESNVLAISAVIAEKKKLGNHIVTSLGEHPSILNMMKRLEKEGFRVTYLPFTKRGTIDVQSFQEALTEQTIFAAIQHGNSEIGSVQPIDKLAQICEEKHIHLHSDCVQTFGKLDLQSITAFADSFSISGHKFSGPKGVGALYIKPSIRIQPPIPDGTHEFGLRAGTVNVPAIAAMTQAATKVVDQQLNTFAHFVQLRQAFIRYLQPIQSYITIFGATNDEQLPGIIGLAIHGIEGQWVMLECNRHGFAISTGSACQVGQQVPTPTMQALDHFYPQEKYAKEFIRISFGKNTTTNDVKHLADCLIGVCLSFSQK